jgi:uncharacterized DUF497 family protein
MRVDWDLAKNESNETKHGIDFETAQLAFDDPNHISFVERIIDGEERWHAVVVVHARKEALSEELISIISGDADVLAWLKAVGDGYQTRINTHLRDLMQRSRKGR